MWYNVLINVLCPSTSSGRSKSSGAEMSLMLSSTSCGSASSSAVKVVRFLFLRCGCMIYNHIANHVYIDRYIVLADMADMCRWMPKQLSSRKSKPARVQSTPSQWILHPIDPDVFSYRSRLWQWWSNPPNNCKIIDLNSMFGAQHPGCMKVTWSTPCVSCTPLWLRESGPSALHVKSSPPKRTLHWFLDSVYMYTVKFTLQHFSKSTHPYHRRSLPFQT